MARQKKTSDKQEKSEPKQKKSSDKHKKTELITGQELIHKVKELDHLSKSEKAKACGYYSSTKNGVERVNMMQFLQALMDAEGIQLELSVRSFLRGKKELSLAELEM